MIQAKEFDGELWIKAADHHQEVKRMVDAEREACAKACEENADDDTEGEWDSACISCAYHVRARGQA